MTMLIKISLFLLPFFCFAEQTALFVPPTSWHAAQPKELHCKIGFVGKGSSNIAPSIALATEKVDCDLKDYLKAVKEIHLSRPNTRWRDLGTLEMKAGSGHLIEIRSGEIVLLQAFYLKDSIVYILTAAVSKEDFLPLQKEILASIKTLDLASNLWSALKEEGLRDRIHACIAGKEWKKVRQLIEKETSSMGEYWQYLALQEAYGKIFSDHQ